MKNTQKETMNWKEAADYITANFEGAHYDSACDEIICDSEEQADEVANKVVDLMGISDDDCHTNYYDDHNDDNDPELNGTWSVYVD